MFSQGLSVHRDGVFCFSPECITSHMTRKGRESASSQNASLVREREGLSGQRGWVSSQRVGVRRQTPPPKMATVVVSTHPTGMHSCLNYIPLQKYIFRVIA